MEGKSSKQNSRHLKELCDAVRTGSVQEVEAALAILKKNNWNLDARDWFGSTALHIATWRNHIPIARRLLDAGADPDIRDGESGWGCLHRALHFGHLAIAGTLIEAGASLHLEDAKARIPADLVSAPLNETLSEGGIGREVFSWGNGSNYQLGTGTAGIQRVPCRVEALQGQDVVAIAAARFHSVAVTSRGEVFSWGFARGGRLGHQDCSSEVAVITPRQISGNLATRRVRSISAAKHHTVVATVGGEVFSWGSNREGQLGYPSVDTQITPRRVSTLRAKVVAVAAANKHTAGITESGDVFTWGCNKEGQLGYGTSNSASNCVPRCVESLKGRKATAVSVAKYHTMVILDGEVFTWGHKMVSPRRVAISRKCGLKLHKYETFRVCAIAAGVIHSTAVSEDGLAFTWRSADPILHPKQLLSMAAHNVVSVSAGKRRTALTTSTGNVYAWDGEESVPSRVHGIKHALKLAVGETHSLALTGIYVPQFSLPGEAPRVPEPAKPSMNEFDSDDETEPQPETPASKNREAPSLRNLCQRVMAEAVMDPKNAMQLLDFAECVGAKELRLYCENFVLRNLDYVLTVAPAAFGAARPSLLAELEKRWDVASWSYRQLPVPSATLPAVVDTEDENEVNPRTRKVSMVPAVSVSGFLPEIAKASEDRRTKHLRAIRKKLQQIEVLEWKLSKGQALDEQQMAKLNTKSALLRELESPLAEEGGSRSIEDPEHEQPPPKLQRRKHKKNKPGKAGKAGDLKPIEDELKLEAEAKAEKKAENIEAKSEIVGFNIEPKSQLANEPTQQEPSSVDRKKSKSRKGGLSMFLSGALDNKKPVVVEPPPPPIVKSEGPAWGGASKRESLSLREIQNEQKAASVTPSRSPSAAAAQNSGARSPAAIRPTVQTSSAAQMPGHSLATRSPGTPQSPGTPGHSSATRSPGTPVRPSAASSLGVQSPARFIAVQSPRGPQVARRISRAVPMAVPASQNTGNAPAGTVISPIPQNGSAPWVGAVSPPARVTSLRDIQMQQVKQKEKQRPPSARVAQGPVAVAASSSTPPQETSNCWFRPDNIGGHSTLRCIQIEEKAMKDLRKFYKDVKMIQE